MSISKFISISRVGRLLDVKASGDTSLSKCTLIFAENGRGKTTLCAILRSLQSGDPANIIGRRSLSYAEAPSATIRLEGENAKFRNGSWDKIVPDISIYDTQYVSNNVHSGEVVDTQQKRNLYRAIVGREGVQLAKEIEQITGDISNLNPDIRIEKANVEKFIPEGVAFQTFLEMAPDENIDQRLAEAEQRTAAIKQSQSVQERDALKPLEIPDIPGSLGKILGKSLENIAQDAQDRIQAQIAKHNMGDAGEAWIASGLNFATDDDCPFCGQSLNGIELVTAYRAYFSEAYEIFVAEIEQLGRELDELFGTVAAANIQNIVASNSSASEFWEKFCQFEKPTLLIESDASQILTELLQGLMGLMVTKQSRPLEAIDLQLDQFESAGAYRELQAGTNKYNELVNQANIQIEAVRTNTNQQNFEDQNQKLNSLKARKVRYQADAARAVGEYEALAEQKSQLEAKKADLREKLDDYTDRVIEQYGDGINRYLDKIGAGFEITTPTHNYRGGQPSTEFAIKINGVAVKIGDSNTPLSEPCFSNTLSSGDKSTLALAFFLTQLEHDPDSDKKIVVFDDPFTSQDSFRRNHTAFQIKKCVENNDQVIVFSHDAQFLKEIHGKVSPDARKTLQLTRVGEENTIIAEWDIDKAVLPKYQANLLMLQEFYSEKEGLERDVVQKMRPVLETYCRFVCPEFSANDNLGEIVGRVRRAGQQHPLYSVLDDLDELNDYTRRYHHGENQNSATEPISEGELNSYVKRTLKIVGKLQ